MSKTTNQHFCNYVDVQAHRNCDLAFLRTINSYDNKTAIRHITKRTKSISIVLKPDGAVHTRKGTLASSYKLRKTVNGEFA